MSKNTIDLIRASAKALQEIPAVRRRKKWTSSSADSFVKIRSEVLTDLSESEVSLVYLMCAGSPLTASLLSKLKKRPTSHSWIQLNGVPVCDLFTMGKLNSSILLIVSPRLRTSMFVQYFSINGVVAAQSQFQALCHTDGTSYFCLRSFHMPTCQNKLHYYP